MTHELLFTLIKIFANDCIGKTYNVDNLKMDCFLSPENYKSFQHGCATMWQAFTNATEAHHAQRFDTVKFCGMTISAFIDEKGISDLLVFYANDNKVITEKL